MSQEHTPLTIADVVALGIAAPGRALTADQADALSKLRLVLSSYNSADKVRLAEGSPDGALLLAFCSALPSVIKFDDPERVAASVVDFLALPTAPAWFVPPVKEDEDEPAPSGASHEGGEA